MKIKNKVTKILIFSLIILNLNITIFANSNNQDRYTSENFIDEYIFTLPRKDTDLQGIEFIYYWWGLGFNFHSIPTFISDLVNQEEYWDWKNQFYNVSINGHKDPSGLNLLSVIQTFNISKEDFIAAYEKAVGNIPIDEIDRLVIWARTVDTSKLDANDIQNRREAGFWRHQYSLQGIEALYSNDIEQLWAAFPGAGAMINGRVYSPEWIINNMEQAIVEERIPVPDILDVMQFTSHFYELEDTNRMALSAFRRGVLRLRLIEMEENNIEYIPYEDILLDISYN